MFALCGVFFWVTLTSPSDATRVDPGADAWQRGGVVVAPLTTQPRGLHAGDIVVAINGRSLESWSSSLFQPGAAMLRTTIGQQAIYTVIRNHRRLDVPVVLGAYPLGAAVSANWGMLIFVVVFILVGLYVYMRRSTEAAAAVLFFSTSCLLGASAWLFGMQVISLTGGDAFWLYSISVLVGYLLFWSALVHFSLVFPGRSALTRSRPWLVPAVYALPCAAFVLYLSVTHALAPSTLAWLGLWEPGEASIGVIYVALAVVTMTVNYRTDTDPAIRHKIRWVVFASIISGGASVLLWIIPMDVFGQSIISTNALGLLLLPFPSALAIAILRYRLFDIDVIINRALVYGTLTVALTIVYFACVIGLQAIVQAAIGANAGQTSPLALLGSTLASAVLFQPLRGRIQTFIDHRFYRSKYDTARLLEAFAATLRTEFDLAQLSQQLVALVEGTMQPTSVTLWLRAPDSPAHADDARLWKQAALLESAVQSRADPGDDAVHIRARETLAGSPSAGEFPVAHTSNQGEGAI
jgi:hypothetical protein